MDRQSLLHYLQHSKGFIGAVNKTNYGDIVTSGYVMDYSDLEDMGYDFRKVTEMPGDSVGDDTEPVSTGDELPF
jgi:hypothetical protein